MRLGQSYRMSIRRCPLMFCVQATPRSLVIWSFMSVMPCRANLAVDESNRTGIRLAGGVPPLMKLMMDRPSEQVGQLAVCCLCSCWQQVLAWLGLAALDEWASEQEGQSDSLLPGDALTVNASSLTF